MRVLSCGHKKASFLRAVVPARRLIDGDTHRTALLEIRPVPSSVNISSHHKRSAFAVLGKLLLARVKYNQYCGLSNIWRGVKSIKVGFSQVIDVYVGF